MSRKFTIKNHKNFKKIGYFTKKNYLNSNDVKKLFKSFEKMKFEQISQKKNLIILMFLNHRTTACHQQMNHI